MNDISPIDWHVFSFPCAEWDEETIWIRSCTRSNTDRVHRVRVYFAKFVSHRLHRHRYCIHFPHRCCSTQNSYWSYRLKMKTMAHIRCHQTYHYDSVHISIDAIAMMLLIPLRLHSIGSFRWMNWYGCCCCWCFCCYCSSLRRLFLLVEADQLDTVDIRLRFVHISCCLNYSSSRSCYHELANVQREHFHPSPHHQTVRHARTLYQLQLNAAWGQMGRLWFFLSWCCSGVTSTRSGILCEERNRIYIW